jgi:hypothetical protein
MVFDIIHFEDTITTVNIQSQQLVPAPLLPELIGNPFTVRL